MLACVIFGALAGVFAAIYALAQGLSFGDAFGIYLGISLFSMVGVPVMCMAARRLRQLVKQAQTGHLVTRWSNG